jgi:hypothetical protein
LIYKQDTPKAKCYCRTLLKNVVQDEKKVTSTANPNLFPEARCNKFLYLYTRSAAPIYFSLPTPEHIQIEEKRGKFFAQRSSSQLG